MSLILGIKGTSPKKGYEFMKINRTTIFKILLAVIALAICIAIIVYLFPIVINLSTPEGQLEFKEKIDSLGFLGLLMLFGIQFAQIFLIIIPGEPIEVLAGMCYGGIGGTIFITASVAILTTLIIFMVRKLGRKFVYEFCNKKQIEKLENSKLMKNTEKIEFIMLILFLIPGTPKDLLVYIGGLLPIKPLRFILISTFARLPSVVSSTFAGENIVSGDWIFSIMIYVVTFVIIGIVIFLVNKFDKSNTTRQVLDTMKK